MTPADNSIQERYAHLLQHFAPLYDDLQADESFPRQRPLLAHYTSVETLECVLRTNEIWFSNPLFMDDVEEIRFGITQGTHQFLSNDALKTACRSESRAQAVCNAFETYYQQYANEQVLDVFVLCLSKHVPSNADGRLSMWRGYGGNGKGIALVLDTAKLEPIDDSPLIISNVVYASTEERLAWLTAKMDQFAALLTTADLPDDKLYLAAHLMFERLKLFALFSKHVGFSEEQEWRVVYLKERDVQKRLEPMLHYAIGKRGVEPKLKLKLAPTSGVTPSNFSLEMLTYQIILGPSASSPLAAAALRRMFDKLGRPDLKTKLVTSNIPFRPGHLG